MFTMSKEDIIWNAVLLAGTVYALFTIGIVLTVGGLLFAWFIASRPPRKKHRAPHKT